MTIRMLCWISESCNNTVAPLNDDDDDGDVNGDDDDQIYDYILRTRSFHLFGNKYDKK